jgi:hypothetical protein
VERKGLTLYAYNRRWTDKANHNYFNRVDVTDNDSTSIYIYTTKDLGERLHRDEFYIAAKNCYFNSYEIDRTDPDLIWVVENLGDKANTIVSKLKVIEIPDDVDYVIEEYDGNEWAAETHRTWG